MATTIFPEITPVSNDGTLVKGIIVDRQGYPSGTLTLNWATPTGGPSAATASIKVYSNSAASYTSPTPILLTTLETAQNILTSGAETWEIDLTLAGRYIYIEYDATYTGGTTPASIVSADFELNSSSIYAGLTTLAAVKLEAGLASTDTTHDALIESLISSASAGIRLYLDREITRTTHTSEVYSVNGSQLLYLQEYPIKTLTSVLLAGATLTVNVDYYMNAEDAKAGRIYRPGGWVGNYYSRGTFPDVYAGARDISVTYTAGWYLPADAGYVAGADDSLPVAIQSACNRAVLTRFRTTQANADGIKQYSEGGISTTWFGPESTKASFAGFDSVVCSMLNPYKRREAV